MTNIIKKLGIGALTGIALLSSINSANAVTPMERMSEKAKNFAANAAEKSDGTSTGVPEVSTPVPKKSNGSNADGTPTDVNVPGTQNPNKADLVNANTIQPKQKKSTSKPNAYETFNVTLPDGTKLKPIKVAEFDKKREGDIISGLKSELNNNSLVQAQFPNGFSLNKTTISFNNLSGPFNKDIILKKRDGKPDTYDITFVQNKTLKVTSTQNKEKKLNAENGNSLTANAPTDLKNPKPQSLTPPNASKDSLKTGDSIGTPTDLGPKKDEFIVVKGDFKKEFTIGDTSDVDSRMTAINSGSSRFFDKATTDKIPKSQTIFTFKKGKPIKVETIETPSQLAYSIAIDGSANNNESDKSVVIFAKTQEDAIIEFENGNFGFKYGLPNASKKVSKSTSSSFPYDYLMINRKGDPILIKIPEDENFRRQYFPQLINRLETEDSGLYKKGIFLRDKDGVIKEINPIASSKKTLEEILKKGLIIDGKPQVLNLFIAKNKDIVEMNINLINDFGENNPKKYDIAKLNPTPEEIRAIKKAQQEVANSSNGGDTKTLFTDLDPTDVFTKYVIPKGTSTSGKSAIYDTKDGTVRTANLNLNLIKRLAIYNLDGYPMGENSPESVVLPLLFEGQNSNALNSISAYAQSDIINSLTKGNIGDVVSLLRDANLNKIKNEYSCIDEDECFSITSEEIAKGSAGIGFWLALKDTIINKYVMDLSDKGLEKSSVNFMVLQRLAKKDSTAEVLKYLGYFTMPGHNSINAMSTGYKNINPTAFLENLEDKIVTKCISSDANSISKCALTNGYNATISYMGGINK